MDISKLFGTNKNAETDGVWIDLGDGGKLLIARLGNENYTKVAKQLFKPHEVMARNRNLSEEIQKKITIEATATAILLGWDGLEAEGKKLVYSKENAILMLTKYPDFRDLVSSLAMDIKNFQVEAEVADAKN